MKKLVVACQKGGVGKSTLCLNLLGEAIKRGFVASIHDADPQGSCMLMSDQRARIHGQRLPVSQDMASAGDLVIVDTAPHANAQIPAHIMGADLVIVPTRPAVLDMCAAQTTLDVCRNYGVPVAVVLMLPASRSAEIEEGKAWVLGQGIELAGIVHHRIDVARSAGEGLALLESHPRHAGTAELAAVADFAFNAINLK